MRRAVVLAALLAVAACGDGEKTPHAPPPVLASSGPFETMFDDAQLEARVLEAARSGRTDGLSSLKLPPRCDRVRVAVRALHDVLAGTAKDAPPRAALLSALDALAKCEGGASAKSLGPLVAAWRGWSDAQAAAEKDLAGRAASCLAELRKEKPDAEKIAAPIERAPAPPPTSPALAELSFFRAASRLLAAPNDAVSSDIAAACGNATKLFSDLGWPGGFGTLADELLPRLSKKNPKSFLAAFVADATRAAYAQSGDELRASLVFLAQADAAEAGGDVERAERAADAALQRLSPTGARGRERFDVLRRHGELAQRVGKQAVAARDLAKALEEAKWAGLDVSARVDVAAPLATSLFRLGRFEEALAVAREAAASAPDRAGLEEIAAESASELGRFADAADHYRAASSRYEALAKQDAVKWTPPRDVCRLLAARSQARDGDADGAAKTVADVLAKNGAPGVRAFAAGVLREAKRLDDAERELTRAATDGGPEFADSLVVERARIAVARGDAVNARAYFGSVVERLTKGDVDKLVGWDLAQPLLDWARMETGLGRLYEASELAGRAVIQLRGSGLEWDLDRARKLYVDLQRRRGWFVDAEKATTQRLAAPVGDIARKEDVLLDLLFIRVELVQQRAKDAETSARATAAMFPEDWRRECAVDAVEAALGRPMRCPPTVPASLDARSRWGLLRDLLSGAEHAANVAERAGAAEPELRRWALSRSFGSGHDEFLVEMRRRSDPTIPVDVREFVTNEDEAVLLVEPLGARTIVRLLLKGRVVAADVDGDAGLADFWDATWVAPSPANLEAAAKRVSSSLFPAEIATELRNVQRLWISVPEPLGPLPFDLLTCGTSKLLTSFEVMTVNSLSELSRCRELAAQKTITALPNPYAPLDARNAIVQVGSVDAGVRARFLSLVAHAPGGGSNARFTVRDAKIQLRNEWSRELKTPPGLPPWCAFLLRGAP